jgi:hypothetical protein
MFKPWSAKKEKNTVFIVAGFVCSCSLKLPTAISSLNLKNDLAIFPVNEHELNGVGCRKIDKYYPK